MRLQRNSGWVEGVLHCPSPNCNERPQDEEISLLVIHNISLPPGQFGTGQVQLFFQNRLPIDAHPYYQSIADLRVSAHFLIERDGVITQFVDCGRRAWHAGISRFEGREGCNDFSIGIELEGTDDLPYENVQYIALAELIQVLRNTYPALVAERICGHCDIAPERKTDPGASFDWAHLHALLEDRQQREES